MKQKVFYILFKVLFKPFDWIFNGASFMLYQLYRRFGKPNKGALHHFYFYGLTKQTYRLLRKQHLVKAQQQAKELIKTAENFQDDWNYGNAIHHANTVLGLVSLKTGDINQAENYLKASGAIVGSPQLNSFGPTFELANELLLLGQKESVLHYLSQISKFWEGGKAFLPSWSSAINQGEHPQAMQNFHTNKRYR